MKIYDITQKPFKIYGLAVTDSEKRQFWKLPPHILEEFPSMIIWDGVPQGEESVL